MDMRRVMKDFSGISLPWPGWRITEELGTGSYGTVFRIGREKAGYTEEAALKIIDIPRSTAEYEAVRAGAGSDEAAAEYFEQSGMELAKEFNALDRLKGNSNVVSIEDWDIVKQDNGYSWRLFIRMELLTRLGEHIKVRGDYDEDEVIRLGTDICSAIVLCEKEKLIHRDIKPENIMVSKHGSYKLTDFGIAKNADHSTYATLAGTQQFMAP